MNFSHNYKKFDELLLNDFSRKSIQQVYIDLNSNEKGLNDDEVVSKRKILWLNEIEYEKAPSWYTRFVEGLLSQTLIVHMISTRKIPFIESRAATLVISLTMIVIAIGIFIPFSFFANSLKFTALPLQYFLWLFLLLFCYYLLTQFVKMIFIKKFNQWL
ncbi:MAG: cation-transporting P-type ATPase [Bacteroidota bacterium]